MQQFGLFEPSLILSKDARFPGPCADLVIAGQPVVVRSAPKNRPLWSTVGQLIERRAVIIPNDEKLVAQLTSRRKQYDSKGREKIESKADLRARGVESPDRADAIMGSIILAQNRQVNWAEARELRDEINRRARRLGDSRFAGISPKRISPGEQLFMTVGGRRQDPT
jgi:hypothetical protein